MTDDQLKNWYRFALRMSHRGWKGLPHKSRKQIASYVKDFFRRLENFDDPDEPLLPRVRSWDDTDECAKCVANRPEAERTQNWYKLNTCHCQTLICDVFTEIEEGWNPYYYNHDARIHEGGYAYQKWQARWADKVRCCIRAGLDMAAERSAGVLGFEVCDLRRMYRDRIPSWINDGSWLSGTEHVATDLNQGNCAVGIWL